MGFKPGLRNFWLDAEIDGRESHLRGGPEGNGSMHIELMMLVNGRPVNVLRIDCKTRDDGERTISVYRPFLPDGVTVELDASIRAEDGTLESVPPSAQFNNVWISTRR